MDLVSSIIEKFQHVDDTIDIDESNLTPIQEFYKDAKIFVTGFTGFLGQVLVEKLLRSCPVSTIYVLIRQKKGKSVDARLQEKLDDHVFGRLKKICPHFRQKVVAIEGDCALPGLGLGDQDRKLLIDEVNVVFHVAATVRFDEHLKRAVAINVRGTRDVCLLVQQMPHLKSFLHVSTAFSNCDHNVIEEKVYRPSMDYNHLIEISESLDNLLLNNMSRYFVGKYPNAYVYTKQVAEDVIKQLTEKLPAGIYRPAIVVSTYKEPIRGWINNLYGAVGVFYGSAMGLIRVLYCDGEFHANIVPVDMCINGLIASAWDSAERFAKTKVDYENFEIPVYNCETSSDKSITWKEFKYLSSKYSYPFPSIHYLWVFSIHLVKSYYMYLVWVTFLHFTPGVIIDGMLFLTGKKMRMVQTYKKIHYFSALFQYFSINNFKFNSSNINKMLGRMTKKDQEVFFCDFRKLDWEDFFHTFGLGARVYLVKDPIETIPESRIFYRRLQWADRALKTVLGLLGVIILWFVISSLY